jgi:4-amino-4-deoxy-L-arabinose transferase-like glycosyltransferase
MQLPRKDSPAKASRSQWWSRSIFSNATAIALCFFLLAGLVRLCFIITHPNFNNVFSIRGVPYSDGQQWTSAAINLARGHGLGTVYRPGFSILLALFYVWSGPSFHVISALHVLIGALTAALIYLVGKHTFGHWIATAAACFFVFDPSQIFQTPQASTEPLGLMFFVASVYCLVLVCEREKVKPATVGGILLGLSNLTRPLTLFCAPFYAGHLVLARWLYKRKWRKAVLPAIAFCAGVLFTMSPWLVRQKVVHGVWAVSTNLGEALYAATSPKYNTWTPLVRADADLAGIDHSVRARYQYFIAESLKHIQQNPGFYARQVVRSYWQFLNCFNREVRSETTIFPFPRLTGLIEAQILFAWITAALLLGAGVRAWIRSGSLEGCVFLLVSSTLFAAWRLAPSFFGVVILTIGVTTSVFMVRRWQSVGLLGWSLAATGVGDAIFNNAILYRAVLMTDWIFSLFYLAAFYNGAAIITRAVLCILGKKTKAWRPSTPVRTVEPLVLALDHWTGLTLKAAALAFAAFALASSARLLIVNSTNVPRSVPPRLSNKAQRDVIAHLRNTSAIMHQALPEPEGASLTFVEPAESSTAQKNNLPGRTATTSPSRVSRDQGPVVVGSETLSRYVFYFPKDTEFEQRDRLFTKRPFDCSIFRTTQGMAVFPGRIPQWLGGREVVLVGRIDGFHPGGSRLGKIVQCMAIIPILDQQGKLDYRNAVTLPVQVPGVF